MRVVLTQPAMRGTARENFRYLSAKLDSQHREIAGADVIVLPELIGIDLPESDYHAALAEVATRWNAHVVGGSHIRRANDAIINQGLVVSPEGDVVTRYEKANPYAAERSHGAAKGSGGASFTINGVRCFSLICADFFHAQTFNRLSEPCDVIFVAASSVSRKPTPDLARARWKHAMIARAFEQAGHVAVSDWAYPVKGLDGVPASGVAGLALPDADTPQNLISLLGEAEIAVYGLDISRGRALLADQQARGFAIAETKE